MHHCFWSRAVISVGFIFFLFPFAFLFVAIQRKVFTSENLFIDWSSMKVSLFWHLVRYENKIGQTFEKTENNFHTRQEIKSIRFAATTSNASLNHRISWKENINQRWYFGVLSVFVRWKQQCSVGRSVGFIFEWSNVCLSVSL